SATRRWPARSPPRSAFRTSFRTSSARACSRPRSSRCTRVSSARAAARTPTGWRVPSSASSRCSWRWLWLSAAFARPAAAVVVPGVGGFAETDPVAFAKAVQLTRILFPSTGLLVLSAWCLGVLNSHRKFFLSYAAPVVWNLAQIAVLVAAGPRVDEDRLTTLL